MPSTRRSLLASAAAALAGAAGCLSEPGDQPATPTTTRTETTTETTTTTATTTAAPTTAAFGESVALDGLEVTPSDPRHQHSLHWIQADTGGVETFDGTQALLVTVAAQGDPLPSPGDFAVEAGGERHRGWVDRDHRSYQYYSLPYAFGPDVSPGWVGFEVPVPLDVDTAALVLAADDAPVVRWPLPDETVAALGAPPPTFELVSFEAPDAVGADEPIEVRLTVRNTGDGNGAFRASLNTSGYVHSADLIEVPVPAGEARTWTRTFDSHVGRAGAARLALRLEGPVRDVDHTVQVGSG